MNPDVPIEVKIEELLKGPRRWPRHRIIELQAEVARLRAALVEARNLFDSISDVSAEWGLAERGFNKCQAALEPTR